MDARERGVVRADLILLGKKAVLRTRGLRGDEKDWPLTGDRDCGMEPRS